MHLGSFLNVNTYKMGDIFWLAKISNIFGVLEILEQQMLGPSLRMKKK